LDFPGITGVSPKRKQQIATLQRISAEVTLYVSILASHIKPFFLYSSSVPANKFMEAISTHVAQLLKEERENVAFRSMSWPKRLVWAVKPSAT